MPIALEGILPNKAETLFKGLTRPALFFGVPVVPLVLVCGVIFVLGTWTRSVLVWGLIPVAVFVMRMQAKKDDHVFSLLGLKLKMRTSTSANTKKVWGTDTLSPHRYENIEVPDQDASLKIGKLNTMENIIPYSSHVHDKIVKTKDGNLIVSWEFSGVAFECMDNLDIDLLKSQCASIYNSLADFKVTFYWHNLSAPYYDELEGDFGNPFSEEINGQYTDTLRQKQFLKNNLYLSVVLTPLSKLERKGNRMLPLEKKKALLHAHINDMLEIAKRVHTALEPFKAIQLGIEEEDGKRCSSMLSLFNYLLSGRWQKIRVTHSPFYQVLGTSTIHIAKDTGQMVDAQGKSTFFRCVEIKDYDSETISGVFDELLYADVRYVWTQSFSLMNKNDSLSFIKSREKQLMSTEDDAVSQLDELAHAKDDVAAGRLKMGMHHFSIFVYADSYEAVMRDTSRVMDCVSSPGFTSTVANIALMPAFCAQLPGMMSLRPRLAGISHRNFASMASMHNFMIGKRSGNPWGDAVCLFKTPNNHACFFNFHESALNRNEVGKKTTATTSVLGATGSGKTMLLMFLLNSLQKFGNPLTFAVGAKSKRLTTVFLDKDHGGEIGIRAMGGRYFSVATGEPTGWNPFFLDSNKRNIAFLKDLVRLLCSRRGETLSARENESINKAVEAVMSWPQEARTFGITRIYEHLMDEGDSKQERQNSLKVRLKSWLHGNEFGWVFDNEHDLLDLNQSDIVGIDGTAFLDDVAVCTPISFYLIYRITQLLDGRRLVIFMDEFWKWISDEAFRDFVYNKLKTIRKLNGFIVAATQSPEEILKNQIARAFIEQSANMIALPNPKAKES